MKKTTATALLTVLSLPLLHHAWAQQTPPSDSPPSMPSSASAQPRPDSGLVAVRDKLGLQETQWPAWQRYETAVGAYVTLHFQQNPVLASAKDAAPQQIRRLVDQQSNRLAALEDIESASKALYAVLNTEQQATANQLLLGTIPSIGGGTPPDSASRDRGGRPEGGNRGGPRSGGPGGGMGGMGGGGMGR